MCNSRYILNVTPCISSNAFNWCTNWHCTVLLWLFTSLKWERWKFVAIAQPCSNGQFVAIIDIIGSSFFSFCGYCQIQPAKALWLSLVLASTWCKTIWQADRLCAKRKRRCLKTFNKFFSLLEFLILEKVLFHFINLLRWICLWKTKEYLFGLAICNISSWALIIIIATVELFFVSTHKGIRYMWILW